jgi:hypothetical protein
MTYRDAGGELADGPIHEADAARRLRTRLAGKAAQYAETGDPKQLEKLCVLISQYGAARRQHQRLRYERLTDELATWPKAARDFAASISSRR